MVLCTGSYSQSEYVLYKYLHPLLRQDRLHVLYHDYEHPQLLTIQSATLVCVQCIQCLVCVQCMGVVWCAIMQ